MEERVTVNEAASELRVSVLTLRGLMQQNKLNIGYAIKQDGNKRWSYFIYRKLLNEEKQRLGIGDKNENIQD